MKGLLVRLCLKGDSSALLKRNGACVSDKHAFNYSSISILPAVTVLSVDSVS